MNVDSVRADGWQDVAASLVMVAGAVFFWYMHDFYLDWPIVVAGLGAGVLVYGIAVLAANHRWAGFLPTMLFVISMIIALRMRLLVAGVVSALLVLTALKVSEVYL
ncbi:hypothetical protein PNQ92_13385 [Halobacterium salinarum]|uniref:hypothetical protein n=1 Tax=Halobacterium salinarum TaxID=2242 RepID=UPI0025527475|nr:hypothetical protein [Halobacterium salinarum]MDL0126391.1 hypothetical protein [Halobacterium salinarum]MDL0134307.1 hypothetical protein [Halobacterium salinarum]